MTINIYGNITVAGNSSITTNHSSRSSRSRPARPQSVTQPRRNNRRRHNSIAVENLVIEDHVQHHDIDNHAGNHHARERLLIEAPRRQRDQSVVIAPPPRRNAPLPRRRSSRIARRALLNAQMYPRRRRPIPAAHEDHDFWTKIWTLPRRRSLSTGDLDQINTESSRGRSQGPLSTSLQGRRSSSQRIRGTNGSTTLGDCLIVSTAAYQIPKGYLQRPACLIGMLQVAHGAILKGVKHRTSQTALHMNKLQIEQTTIDANYTGRAYWEDLPLSLPTLYTMLNLEIKLESQILCPECFTLHGTPFEKIDETYKMKCDALRFL
ncbi:uncharacterized protein MELLADRAFT_114176, partial [Melampsora larici-populina 98AG31]